MALQFVSKVCGCGKAFKTSNDSEKCYDCTLEDITHGNPPEEGDFNTAGIVSGTLTEIERSYLQADLQAVELGTSTESMGYDDETEWLDWEDDQYEDGRYLEVICPGCGEDLNFCICPGESGKYFAVVVDCPDDWYAFNLKVPESEVKTTQDLFVREHKEQCGCEAEPTISVSEV